MFVFSYPCVILHVDCALWIPALRLHWMQLSGGCVSERLTPGKERGDKELWKSNYALFCDFMYLSKAIFLCFVLGLFRFPLQDARQVRRSCGWFILSCNNLSNALGFSFCELKPLDSFYIMGPFTKYKTNNYVITLKMDKFFHHCAKSLRLMRPSTRVC